MPATRAFRCSVLAPFVFAASLLAAWLTLPAAALAEPTHPRLFLNAAKVAELRAASNVAGSTHQLAYQALKARVDKWDLSAPSGDDKSSTYANSYLAQSAAMVYLISNDKKYANIAHKALEDVFAAKDATPTTGSGLARATIGMGFAVAYDWCYDAWSPQQRDFIRGKITEALDAWPKFGHSNFSGPTKASNWVAVCRGGELFLLIAAGEEQARADRFNSVRNDIKRHLSNAYGDMGITQEGNGYCGYAGIFLLPSVYALQSIGDRSLDPELAKKAFWKLAMYSASSIIADQYNQRDYLQYGVGGHTIGDEGWVSLLLNSVPPDMLPAYTWFYDRHMGKLSGADPANSFDPRRQGTIWALLYYPTKVTPVDPLPKLGPAALDKADGYAFFRNRWQNADDILVTLMGDNRSHDKGWNQPDALNLGLIAHGNHFIGGPSKERDSNLYSCLLVNGKAYPTGKGGSTANGKLETFEPSKTGGYAIASGGGKYQPLGVDEVKRHLAVEFLGDAAILSTLDQIKATASNTYAWNANIGDEAGDMGIKVAAGNESGRPTFTLTGKNNAYVKAWVLHPADAVITAADPLQVTTTGSNADLWIVMTVGQGTPPSGAVTGQGMSSVLKLNASTIRFDPAKNRVIVGK